jgi:post-segregation antitoxin (ccd killing protein)
MGGKVSICLYIDRDVPETAKKVELNISRVFEKCSFMR